VLKLTTIHDVVEEDLSAADVAAKK
jgi:hypothetical protein